MGVGSWVLFFDGCKCRSDEYLYSVPWASASHNACGSKNTGTFKLLTTCDSSAVTLGTPDSDYRNRIIRTDGAAFQLVEHGHDVFHPVSCRSLAGKSCQNSMIPQQLVSLNAGKRLRGRNCPSIYSAARKGDRKLLARH